MFQKIYKFLSSAKLALALLILILACCVFGVTVFRGQEAWEVIFSAVWFNGILVILIVNISFCFFPRVLRRRLTVVSFGMILFHLSFLGMLFGIVYNSFFFFHGTIRLTEGEVLPIGSLASWDITNRGRYFDLSKLKGEISLMKMHRGYVVEGEDKVVAYEVAIGHRGDTKQGVLYITNKLSAFGFDYYRDKEGFSPLVMLHDKRGRRLHGFFIPLQSLQNKWDESFLYTTGTKEGPGTLPFPQDPLVPEFSLQVIYIPDPEKERAGDAVFRMWPLGPENRSDIDFNHSKDGREATGDNDTNKQEGLDETDEDKPIFEGRVMIGEKFPAGKYYLSVPEIRYWVAMSVRHDPGFVLVLTSLWVGLSGMVITFIGRMRRSKKKS
ncbi:MAG: hypothetical protein JSV21_01950 [Nitrospirota bacterium]|nr:MAG: hypothetical protein JSV21_01950 [Nitrospirota bacterium]